MQKLETLTRRLLEGRVVPFLGAGVSLPSSTDDIPGWKTNRHDAREMTATLAQELACSSSGTRTLPKGLLDKPDTPGLAELCELYVDRQADPLTGQMNLVRLLDIQSFRDLRPTIAHRCIAFLAREGIFREVLTTNYDACIERAFIESLGVKWTDGRQWIQEEPERAPVAVVSSLEKYRRAGHHPRPRPGDVPTLRVVKLNGCAHALAGVLSTPGTCGVEKDPIVRGILLTERALQDWRDRGWARDLFRDRLRTRNVVFSGFGSPEPQVRHTAGLVAEEFGNGSRGRGSLLDVENSPFVAMYRREPSFQQWQIVSSFRDANHETAEANDLLIGPVDREGGFRFPTLPSGPLPEKLSADEFWEELYCRAAEVLLDEISRPRRSEFARELAAYVNFPDVLCTLVNARLRQDGSGKPSEWTKALLERTRGDAPRFSVILACLLGSPRGWVVPKGVFPKVASGTYVSLHADGATLLLLLLLAVLLDAKCPDVDEEGVVVRCGGDAASRGDPLVERLESRVVVDNPGGTRSRVLVTPTPWRRRHVPVSSRVPKPDANGTLAPACPAVDLISLLRDYGDNVMNEQELRALIRAALRAPTSFARSRRDSVTRLRHIAAPAEAP